MADRVVAVWAPTAPVVHRRRELWLLVVVFLLCGSCRRAPAPSAREFLVDIDQLQRAHRTAESRAQAAEALQRYGSEDAYWRFRFGLYLDPGPDAAHQALLTGPLPDYVRGTRAEIYILWDRAAENAAQRKALLDQAQALAERLHDDHSLARVDFRLAGYWMDDANQPARAADLYEDLIRRLRPLNEPVLLLRTVINMSFARIRQERYDEAVALCQQAAGLLEQTPDDVDTIANNETNLGWSLLQLGDDAEALRHIENSVALYKKRGNGREVIGLRNEAAYYVRQRDFAAAQQKLDAAENAALQGDPDSHAAFWADRAEIDVMAGQPDGAREALNKASRASRFSGAIRSQEAAHIRFVEGMIAALRGDVDAALRDYAEVVAAPPETAWGSMRLDAAVRCAELLAGKRRFDDAERHYRQAETILESLRGHLHQDESKLSFSGDSAASFYDKYVDFLVSRGDDAQALRVADRSRARLLSDYQGEQKKPELDLSLVQTRLKAAQALALFYWIGEKQAYLWLIGGERLERVDLASPAEIRTLAQKYYDAVSTDNSAPQTGVLLRDMLLGKARGHLRPNGRVYMMLDGKLGLINPEALPGFSAKWWIEEAIVSVAPSLAILQTAPPPEPAKRSLLAIGDAVGSKEFPRLANFGPELNQVGQLFPAAQRDEIRQRRATPAAYRNANPIGYDVIHFTAHSKAETQKPLDSAIILSEDPDTKAYKLYARDIVNVPIQARLVTISSCKSAVSRTYRGEGVVGLAWAFLRAGAGEVVAGLWNVDDEASQTLMVEFYTRIQQHGEAPALALRNAKLKLMKGYPTPYFWAPFEVFAGYVEPLTKGTLEQ